jgi:RNA polymerase sigma-70 factor, ECF subfamily
METSEETTLLAAALGGDHDAFQHLIEPLRRELVIYGYRLLGSTQDAEDLTQDAFLRAWTKLATFAGRSTFRAWVYRIVTNLGLNILARTPKRALPAMQSATTTAANDAVWLEPLPDALLADVAPTPDAVFSLRESVSLAFMIALHGLPPHQRAALLLRDVLNWHADSSR